MMISDRLARPAARPTDKVEKDQAALLWLQRIERGMRVAQDLVEGPQFVDPARISENLKLMLEAAEAAECIGKDELLLLSQRADGIERAAYERFLDHVLELARSAARGEGRLELPPLLQAVNEIVVQLRRLGIDPKTSDRLKTKLAILRDTTAAGTSTKGKEFVLEGPTVAYKGDRRLYMRYTDPSLRVQLDGRWHETLNWSLGGMLVGAVETAPGPLGALITLRMGIDETRMHEERATIVRYVAKRAELAVRFRRFGSAVIDIKRECAALGVTPR